MSKYGDHTLIEPKYARRWRKRMQKLRAMFKTTGPANVDEGPLLAVLTAIEAQRTPPPETLWALAEAFEEYMKGRGAVDLERSLLGPVWQKAGNYSRRKFKYDAKFEQAVDPARGPRHTLEDRKKAARKFFKVRAEDIQEE